MKSIHTQRHLFLLVLVLFSSITYCQNKDNRIFNDSSLIISEISANSIHSDFGPSIVQDTLYFTTYNDKLSEKSDNKLKRKEYYDLYKAATDIQGNVTGKRDPIKEFITHYNDGPVSWCEKTGELFVTQNYADQSAQLKPFQKEINRLRIMIAKQVNGKWEKVVDFPYNNPEYSVGHPAITESGDTLVFSSDQPGGYGATDLYYSVRRNGAWEVPVNLGPQINTSEKEEFPFITDQHFNGRYLIFSSKGRIENGNFDLYYTRFPSDYSEIVRFKEPINSQFDDFAMTIPTDAEYGYLTTNRPGTGSDDIYKFTFKRFTLPIKFFTLPERFRELYVFDSNSRRPIPGASVASCDKQVYLTDVTGKVASLPCMQNGCKVIVSSIGYSEKAKVLTACKAGIKVITRDTIWMDIATNRKIVLRNIYYDFDKWNILPTAATELDRLVSLLKENPEMKVELSAHTDERGTSQYNFKLSQLRAKSAVDYIISKGINKTRITGKGYGESQLINKCGKNCTPVQHRENRRTEIYVPGFLRSEPVMQEDGDYSNGN
jgi:outer membrane protein OmpA-like peptidoglycan-associated protein